MKRLNNSCHFLVMPILVLIMALIIGIFIFEVGLSQGGSIWKNIYRFIHQKDNIFYIYVIGESTSTGYPYDPKISFPKIASYLFGDKIHNKNIEIINLAFLGKSVESQYWQLFKNLLVRPNSDAILLIYAGINEHVTNGNDPNFKQWGLMQKSTVLSKIQYLLEGRASDGFLLNFLGLNNSLEKFKYRLNKIILLAKRYNLKIIISTLVGNISQFSPQVNGTFTSEDASGLFKSAREFEYSGNFKMAIGVYETILEQPNIFPIQIYYHLGKCYEGLHIYDKAKEYYWKAVDIGDSVRPNHYRNKIIIDLAKEHNIGLVDAIKTFEDRSPYGLLGYNLIIDGHHPNLEGYILLAKEFAKEMESLLGERIVRYNITLEEILNRFDFNSEDILNVYIVSAKWLCLESMAVYDTNDIEDRLIKAEHYLEKAEEIKKMPVIDFWHFVIAALRKDKEKALYWLDRGNLLNENSFVFQKSKVGWPPGTWMLDNYRIFENILPEDISSRIRKLIAKK